MSFPQPAQKVRTLLGFFGDVAGVDRPGEIICQVDSKEFGALDNLYCGAFSVA